MSLGVFAVSSLGAMERHEGRAVIRMILSGFVLPVMRVRYLFGSLPLPNTETPSVTTYLPLGMTER
jgi:hypothetical protein